MKTNILNKATRAFNRAGLKIKKHSPEILIVAGTVGVVTSAVMACKATTKLNDILEEAKNDIDAVHDYMETEKFAEKHTEDEGKKALTLAYVKAGAEVAKLYAPAVALGTVSLAAIIGSHNILNKRNVALATAYATIDTSFKEYRGRVVERFGKELDRELKHDIKVQEVEETVVDEKGKEKTVKKTVDVVDPNKLGDYSRIFYEGNPGWDKDPQRTMVFLKHQQAYANEKLKARGHLFLNEVYDMLGFSRVPDGQIIGWIYDENCPVGDNFVDFGIFDMTNPANVRFVNGDERGLILDFNHDGVIYNKL